MFFISIFMMALFANLSYQSVNSELEYIPKSAGDTRSGLGLVLCSDVASNIRYFLSTESLVSVEKHVRNKLKDAIVPTVPAIRTGQGHNLVRVVSDPDGWKTLNLAKKLMCASYLFVNCPEIIIKTGVCKVNCLI